MKRLIENTTTDVNLETKEKQTAVHLAAGINRGDIVRELVRVGAVGDQGDKFRRTPVMLAIRNHNN